MDETLKVLLTITCSSISLLLGLIANGIRVVYNKQKDLEALVSYLSIQVKDLELWKEDTQQAEAEAKDKRIAELEQQLKLITK